VEMKRREQGNAKVLAFVGGTIIDGNGGKPIEEGRILIDGERIKAVGDCLMPIPGNATQIQATGKFVIPGLMYPQAALVALGSVAALIRCEGRYDEVAIEGAQLALKAGVTTIFDQLGPREALIKARNAIDDGRAIGSRIRLCGHWVGCGGPFSLDMLDHGNEDVGEHSFESRTRHEIAATDDAFKARINALWEVNIGEALIQMPLDEVQQEVREYMESGIDYVSYLVNAHRLPAYSYIAFAPRVQRMIVEEAHRVGLPAQAVFATTEEGVHLALDAGADILVTAPFGGRSMSAETLALIAQRGIFLNILPISATETEWFRRQPSNALYPGLLQAVETEELDHRGLVSAGARIISAGVNQMQSAEVRALLPFASATPHVPEIGEGHISGMEGLQDKGMTAMEALMAATRNVAQAFKMDKDLGTLEPGKLADLILLNKNPLENVQHYRNVHMVVKEGQIIDRDALPTQRLWTALPTGLN